MKIVTVAVVLESAHRDRMCERWARKLRRYFVLVPQELARACAA
jgi:hypothetical protein